MGGLPQFPVTAINRRALFGRAAGGLATAALASLGQAETAAAGGGQSDSRHVEKLVSSILPYTSIIRRLIDPF